MSIVTAIVVGAVAGVFLRLLLAIDVTPPPWTKKHPAPQFEDLHSPNKMADPAETNFEWVTVRTTLPVTPFPAFAVREQYRSSRLCLRELRAEDVQALGILRQQPEVMMWTGQGCPDKDVAATETHLKTMLAPHDVSMFNFAICLGDTGDFIGIGGCHKAAGEFGWPVIGYMFRSEFWGKGYATEFVQAFLRAWWSLPRVQVDLRVEKSTVAESDGAGLHREVMTAVVVDGNDASLNVLRKSGWSIVKQWEEADLRDKEKTVLLYGLSIPRPQ